MHAVTFRARGLRRVVNRLAAAGLAMALAWPLQGAVAAGAAWPQTGHDAAGSAFNAGETTLSASNLASLRPAWTLLKDSSRVVSANGQAFITFSEPDGTGTFQGQLARLDPATGATVWQVLAPESLSSAALVNDLVIVAGNPMGSADGLATAFDRVTGAVRWSYVLPAQPAHNGRLFHPIVNGGLVYLLSRDGDALVLDAATGALVWRHRIDPAPFNNPGGMAVAGGKVFVTDYERGLITLDAADGHELWRYGVAPLANLQSRPLAVGDGVLVNDSKGRVHSLSAAAGQVRWITSTPPSKNTSGIVPMASDGLRVYALNGISKRQLSAIDLGSGTRQWTVNAGVSAKDVTVANGVVYFVGSQLKAVAPATGATIATPTIKSLNAGFSRLSLADGQLFITTMASSGDVKLQAWGLPLDR